MARYLLNDRVYYDDEKCTLTDKNTPDDVISLGATASRCLQILLASRGDVVAKKKLLHEAWEKFGAVVADGSMWQVISQLRKAFELVRLDSRWIINVPRIGYKISQELYIESLSATHPDVAEREKEVVPKSTQNLTALTDTSASANFTPPPVAMPRIQTGSRVTLSTRQRYYYLMFIGLNLLVAVGLWQALATGKGIQPYKQHYSLSHREGEIEVWVQSPHPQKEWASSQEQLKLPAIYEMPDGSGVKYVYVNTMPDMAIRSYFFCHKAINENDNGCASAIYINKTEEG